MEEEQYGADSEIAPENTQPSSLCHASGDEDSDAAYFGLTTEERRRLPPFRLAKAAVKHLSLRDLTAEVHRLLEPDRAHLTRRLQKSADAPAAAIAQVLRTVLARFTEEGTSDMLHDALHYGVISTARTADLRAGELARLLRADPADLTILADHALRDTLAAGIEEFGVSAEARAAAWSAMICTGHRGAIAALAWLVAEPPEHWDDGQRRCVGDLWRQVRERLPELPEHPVSLANLCDIVADLERTGALESAAASAASADAPASGALAERLADLQARYTQARANSLTDVNAAMSAGRIPPRKALKTLESLASDGEALLQEIATATGSPVADTLEQALDDIEVAASARATAMVIDRVRRLAELRGPEYVAVETALIADKAARVDATADPAMLAALDALVTAIDLAGRDPQQFTELVRIVQAGLPAAAVLVMLASNGVLTISDPTRARALAQAQAQAQADDDQPTGPTAGDEPEEPEPEPDTSDSEDAPATEPAASAVLPEPSIDQVLAGLDLEFPAQAELTEPSDEPVGDPAPLVIEGPPAEAVPDLGQARDLYVSLMGSGQYALAAWLIQATERSPVAAAAHRLAAHAVAIRTSTGPNVIAFKDLVASLDADALRELPGVQMLVYAASVRAGLLSPTAGAADPLRDLCPAVVKCGPSIKELTDALLAGIYSGVYLSPRSSNAVAEIASLESEYADLVETARTMLDTASSRSIRYAGATELFKVWMAPAGYLGAALTIVASGSRRAEDIKRVRDQVTSLRSRHELESAIDRDTRTKRSRRIDGPARDKIVERATDVADLLAAWVETAEAIAQSASTGWMSGQIADVRARVTAARESALAELSPLGGSDTAGRNVTVEAGLALLASSLDLLTAGTRLDPDRELPADRVANGMLGLAADLLLDAEPALSPRHAVTVADVAAVASALEAGTAGWNAAFSSRTERADHVGTSVIIEMLRGHDAALARRLATIRERDITAEADLLDEHVAELAARIDSDRRFGRLDTDAWAQLSIRARALEADSRGSRRDFDVMETELGVIAEDRDKSVAATIAAKWSQLTSLQSAQALTEYQATRISECIAAEDITTADEYFETIRARGELPAPRGGVDHLAKFFPAFPLMFTAPSRGLSALDELKRAVDGRRNPDSGRLADALSGADIDIAQIGRPPTVSSLLEQWKILAGTRTLNTKLAQVKPVLEQLGFLVTGENTPHHRKGQVPGVSSWMHLTGVQGTEGGALIPAFGSKISRTGDTLRLLAVWNSPTPGRLVELLRDEPTDQSVVVLYFGTLGVDARRELVTVLRSGPKRPAAIVVDAAAFGYLLAQPVPRRDTTMAITLPFASSAPFTPDVAGLVPVEMFHGRTTELDQVVDMMGSCIVYGGRQLGKSALLRAAARKFNDAEHRVAIYQSIYEVGQGAIPADKIWMTLWPRLAERGIVPPDLSPGDGGADVGAAAIGHITRWVREVPGRQLLLLLDESDFFLDADAKEGKFTHVAALRQLMEDTERSVKVVFAGLHQTARFERLANHPLAHFGDPICVGPLAPQHACDLLTDPLRALGYRFENDHVAARVLALANNQPSLIQLFGVKLLAHLDRRGTPTTLPQIVTAADVEAVWSEESLRESFRKRFDWTLNLDPRYKIIAYSVAYHAHSHGVGSALSQAALRSQCEQWWPRGFAAEDVRTGEFRALLDECVSLGVLSYDQAEGAYRLRTANVLALLGSPEEIDDVLSAADSTKLPDSFDGSLLRPAYAGGPTRSPLTSAQVASLLAARNQVCVVAGTDALAIARCARVLHDENAHAVYGRSNPIREVTAADLESASRSAATDPGHTVVIVDLRTVTRPAAAQAWTQAREAIATTRVGSTLGIVLVTDSAQAPLWVVVNAQADASSRLITLHRYDNTGLRLWLHETTIPFQDDGSRAELLAVSGGWPMLLNRVADACSGEHDADSRASALDDLRLWLDQPASAEELLTALGVRADEVLAAAWDFLVTELSDEATDAQTLAELMAWSAAGGQHPALLPERLSEAGYDSTLALVDVFRILGVLVVDAADGQLRLEAVAARAAGVSETGASETGASETEATS